MGFTFLNMKDRTSHWLLWFGNDPESLCVKGLLMFIHKAFRRCCTCGSKGPKYSSSCDDSFAGMKKHKCYGQGRVMKASTRISNESLGGPTVCGKVRRLWKGMCESMRLKPKLW
jgi:hypothetical protein